MSPGPDGVLEAVACNLCGSHEHRVLFERPYEPRSPEEAGSFAATTDEFGNYGRIVRCLGCGLAFTNPRPTRAALLKGYAACKDESYLSEGHSRSLNAILSLSTISRHVPKGRLIEAGCGAGYFLNAARIDFEVTGFEPGEWACKIAAERFRLDVHPEPFEDSPRLEAGSADALAMIDVIEHLTDPKKALSAAARALRPGGVLYLVTPDMGSLSARLLRGNWWGFRPAHLYYFDRETLGRILREAGFEVVLMKSFGRIFTYAYWLSRLEHYPAPVRGAVALAVRGLGLERKFLYLDTRDSVEVCAQRR